MRRAIWGVFVCVALLSGCASATHGAAPPPVTTSPAHAESPNPPAAPSPSTTPTPSPTPFVSSADEKGAYEFVKAYFAELDRAYNTGDTSGLVPYRESTCSCVHAEQVIEGVYADGGRIAGAHLTLRQWSYGDHGPAFAHVAISFHGSQISHLLPGRTPEIQAPVEGYYFLDLHRMSDRWVIQDLRFNSASS